MAKFKCIVIAEKQFEDEYEFETREEMEGFKHGLGVGADLFGGGSCGAYSREDLPDLDPEWPSEKAAIDLINKYLPEHPE